MARGAGSDTTFVNCCLRLNVVQRTRERQPNEGQNRSQLRKIVIAARAAKSQHLHVSLADSNLKRSLFTDKSGEFSFNSVSFGWFKLRITSIGYSPLVIDSIHVRAERFDFSLNDLVLKQAASQMAEVVVYAEKPLIQMPVADSTFRSRCER